MAANPRGMFRDLSPFMRLRPSFGRETAFSFETKRCIASNESILLSAGTCLKENPEKTSAETNDARKRIRLEFERNYAGIDNMSDTQMKDYVKEMQQRGYGKTYDDALAAVDRVFNFR